MKTNRKARAAWRLLETAQAMAERADKAQGGYQIRNYLEGITIHSEGYAEPGYDGDVVATGNWNDVDTYDRDKKERIKISDLPSRLCAALERIGVSIEWSDEWSTCDDCSKLIRTSADSYGWTLSAWIGDGSIVCCDCVKENPGDYLESLEGDYQRGETIGVDLEANGYVLLEDDFENGWHPGQDASPKLIAKALESADVSHYLFRIDDVGQFDVRFSVYVAETELEELAEELGLSDGIPGALEHLRGILQGKTDGPSVSAAAERALREASRVADTLPDGGVKYVCVDPSTGAVTDARTIDPQTFVEKGIKP